jgi:membrane protein YdbS with pleckstrin-like domain
MQGHPLPTEMPADPIPGYRLLRQLGIGGFGEVWEAVGPGGLPLALKLVPLGGKVGESELRALELIKGIRHAHLLATFGAWQVAGRLIIAVELADGTLLSRLRECIGQGRTGIPAHELLEYMREAAEGLDYLNAPRHCWDGEEGVGIQHRDVKPENLLLVGGTVKVADFGLARLLEQSLASHSGGFTPAYAAPEFFEQRTTPWSDQYSLAVTYCHLRGSRLPFTGSVAALMAGHLTKEPDLTMIPVEERSAVARALAKEPGKRWPNCKEFVTTLATTEIRDEPARPSAPDTFLASSQNRLTFRAKDTDVVPQLVQGEQIIASTRIHGGSLCGTFLFILTVGILFLLMAFFMHVERPVVIAIGIICATLWVLVSLAFLVTRRSSGFYLTDKRILIKSGILTSELLSVPLTQVEGVRLRQGLLGRLLGYGTITLTGTGGNEQECKDIEDPVSFCNQVQEQIAIARR